MEFIFNTSIFRRLGIVFLILAGYCLFVSTFYMGENHAKSEAYGWKSLVFAFVFVLMVIADCLSKS
jgi:hypothetical protein